MNTSSGCLKIDSTKDIWCKERWNFCEMEKIIQLITLCTQWHYKYNQVYTIIVGLTCDFIERGVYRVLIG